MRLVIEPGRAAANYWRGIWAYRELLFFLAWRDVVVRYKQTLVGIAWVLIRPLLTMMVFVAFRKMVGLRAGDIPDAILVMAAVLPWQLFSTALTESAFSLVGNANLITKIYFPRLIIPVASATTSLIDFLITLSLLVLVMAWYGFAPGWQILAMPLFVLLAIAFAAGLGLLLASLNVKYRDFRYIIPFIVQFGVYVSPIAFRTEDVPEQWRFLIALNPLVGIIDGFRWSILAGRTSLGSSSLVLSLVVTVCSLWLGVWYFRRTERGFADVI